MSALLTTTLLEVARRRQDELPGLVESLQDQVLVTIGGTTRRDVYGWFLEDGWRFEERRVHEVFINADRRPWRPSVSRAEDLLITTLHEACHVWAQATGVRDTSRDGRYHNRRFAEIALQIGLEVERDPVIGHRTPRLSDQARYEYADLLTRLEQGLVLVREPAAPAGADGGDDDPDDHHEGSDLSTGSTDGSKYVFASCHCRSDRGRPMTIRVAVGSWRPEVIRCSECQAAFAIEGQDRPM